MSWKLAGPAVLAIALAACGTNSTDRTTGGDGRATAP